MDLASLFKELHGPIDFSHVIQMPNANELAEYLEVDPKYLFEDLKGTINKYFYFDGVNYIQFPLQSPQQLEQLYGDDFSMKEQLKKQIQRTTTMRSEKKYDHLFSMLDKRVAMKVYQEIYSEIPDEMKYDIFIDQWVRAEYGFADIKKEIINDLISVQRFKSEDWKERINKLKRVTKGQNDIKIYRGIKNNGEDERYLMSYTLSLKTAQYFVNRFQDGNGKVIKKIVPVNTIIDYIEDRGEKEVLLLNKRVLNESFEFKNDEGWSKQDADILIQMIHSIKKKINISGLTEKGWCGAICYMLWEEMGKPNDWALYDVKVGNEGHVILGQNKTRKIIDPTIGQFGISDPYEMFSDMNISDEFYQDYEKVSKSEYKEYKSIYLNRMNRK